MPPSEETLILSLNNIWSLLSASRFPSRISNSSLIIHGGFDPFLLLPLANDPKSDLPDSFTVCSSLQVKFQNGLLHLFEMYQKDGSHWFNIHMSIQRGMSMVFRFFYVDPQTGNDIQVYIKLLVSTPPH